MEKLIHQRLYMFLETNKVLNKNQFGFRNKHSTHYALTDTTEKIEVPWIRNYLPVAFL